MQKTGAGFQDLFLYRRNGFEFSSATKKPLSEMAWDYFWGSPASKKLRRDPKDRDELSHVFAALVKGMDISIVPWHTTNPMMSNMKSNTIKINQWVS